MKTIQASNWNKSIYAVLSIAFAIFITFSFSSCARKLTFGVSQVVPAAKGDVKIKKSKNGNYIVDVNVTNLAPPKRLTPPREVYVVWMQTEQNGVRNAGMMKSSTSLLSSTFKGSLRASSTSKPTSVFITAEDDGNVQQPGTQVVLQTQ